MYSLHAEMVDDTADAKKVWLRHPHNTPALVIHTLLQQQAESHAEFFTVPVLD